MQRLRARQFRVPVLGSGRLIKRFGVSGLATIFGFIITIVLLGILHEIWMLVSSALTWLRARRAHKLLPVFLLFAFVVQAGDYNETYRFLGVYSGSAILMPMRPLGLLVQSISGSRAMIVGDTTNCVLSQHKVGKIEGGEDGPVIETLLTCKDDTGVREFAVKGFVYDPETVVKERGR